MSEWPNEDSKRQMRLNIIRHRQKLLKYLENINDTDLKPKIKLDLDDLEEFNLENNIKAKRRSKIKVKEEFNEEQYDSSDELISVGSEEWNASYQTSDEININSRRRSRRIEAVQHDGQKLWKNKTKEDYVYDLDNVINDQGNVVEEKKKRYKKSSVLSRSYSFKEDYNRFRGPIDRSIHNAKERACRDMIARLFKELSKYCSYLNSHRRVPSKHSILLAAKKECDLLTDQQNKLILEKNHWLVVNEMLKKKLREKSSNVIAKKVVDVDC